MEFHKFCPICRGRILTIEQIRENKPCEPCQKEHAQGFRDRFLKAGETLSQEET
ncbi:MAG: hypothetical protein NTX01_07790 [Candidatus Omnitrophica bacterium]|jgi:reverse gyrase|nr:hypothetical protein [Candidatus Omnitrophota bacterium]